MLDVSHVGPSCAESGTTALFGIPDFRFYALADGIRELLFGRQKGLEGFTQMLKTENLQMNLFDP